MAEGGILEDGSEALFDHECIQCRRAHGSRQEAIVSCRDCKQFLCNTCGIYHIRNMVTHTLTAVSSMNQAKPATVTVNPVPIVAKCHYHPDRDIEMYCGTHDMVFCCMCVAKEHRSCVNVHEIKDVAHKSQITTLQTLLADITKVTKRLQDTKMEKSNDLKLIKKQKASILQEIKAVRQRMNKHLDALEQKVIAKLDAEESKLEKEINAEIKQAEALSAAFNQRTPDTTTRYDENETFIIEKLGRVVLTEASTFLEDENVSKRPTLKFEPNDALCKAIEKSDTMGKIIIADSRPRRIQRRNYTVNSFNDVSIMLTADDQYCFTNDLCQLSNGTILLTDRGDNKLKIFDDQLNVKDWLDLNDEPRGLCSVSATEVAVRLSGNTVHFINVGTSLSYQREVFLKQFKSCNSGIACCGNQLWISGYNAVYIYTLAGNIVNKITTDVHGRKLFNIYNPRCIAVSNDETEVYVAALEDSVIVFNKYGDVINELRDKRLTGAISVCVTDDDSVLVLGRHSENVVMFDRDGNSLGELVFSKGMLSCPKSLCYDRRKHRLVVGYDSAIVRIFQLS